MPSFSRFIVTIRLRRLEFPAVEPINHLDVPRRVAQLGPWFVQAVYALARPVFDMSDDRHERRKTLRLLTPYFPAETGDILRERHDALVSLLTEYINIPGKLEGGVSAEEETSEMASMVEPNLPTVTRTVVWREFEDWPAVIWPAANELDADTDERRLTPEQIDKKLSKLKAATKEFECAICLSVNEEMVSVELNCKHSFHFVCIQRWLKTDNRATCAYCRGLF